MARILAFDYGTKRIGIASTDPLQIIANSLDTVHPKDIVVYLKKYLASESVEAFVIGIPKTLQNEESSNSQNVKAFINLIRKNFPEMPLYGVDERFTSSMALDVMITGGMNKKDRRDKANVDKISATIILQSFMEQKQNGTLNRI
jgi:putative Holliday junction resolvase